VPHPRQKLKAQKLNAIKATGVRFGMALFPHFNEIDSRVQGTNARPKINNRSSRARSRRMSGTPRNAAGMKYKTAAHNPTVSEKFCIEQFIFSSQISG
jgi:hypothetical protein